MRARARERGGVSVPEKTRKARVAPTVTIRKDGTVALSYGQARGYSRPPFRPGNMMNLQHGFCSPRVMAEFEEQVTEEAINVAYELLEILHRARHDDERHSKDGYPTSTQATSPREPSL
jgi:hypothetical protein